MTDQSKPAAGSEPPEWLIDYDGGAVVRHPNYPDGLYLQEFLPLVNALESALAEQRERAEAAERDHDNLLAIAKGLAEDLKLAKVRLGILASRMRGCNEELVERDQPIVHELMEMEEAEAFVNEAGSSLAAYRAYLEGREESHE